MVLKIKFALSAVLMIGLAAPGMTQSYQKLSADQLQNTLFGVRLNGQIARSGVAWSACIAPDGRTINRSEGRVSKGTLSISPGARACFSHSETRACFDVYQSGDRLLLEGASEVHVDEVETGIEACS